MNNPEEIIIEVTPYRIKCYCEHQSVNLIPQNFDKFKTHTINRFTLEVADDFVRLPKIDQKGIKDKIGNIISNWYADFQERKGKYRWMSGTEKNKLNEFYLAQKN